MTGSILIVSRNNLSLTKKAVRSAQAQDVPCNVLVVDNNSTDGTREWLRSITMGDTSVIYTKEQRSLSHCWNIGLRSLWGISNAPVLVCNNDIRLRPDAYRLLREQVALGRKLITSVSTDDISKLDGPHPGHQESYDGARPHPDFSCFLIAPEVFDIVGQFDEVNFPTYCNDMDLHLRMHRAGIWAGCIDLPHYHERSSTLKNAEPGEAARIMLGADESRSRFKTKYGFEAGSDEYYKQFEV